MRKAALVLGANADTAEEVAATTIPIMVAFIVSHRINDALLISSRCLQMILVAHTCVPNTIIHIAHQSCIANLTRQKIVGMLIAQHNFVISLKTTRNAFQFSFLYSYYIVILCCKYSLNIEWFVVFLRIFQLDHGLVPVLLNIARGSKIRILESTYPLFLFFQTILLYLWHLFYPLTEGPS